MRTDVSPQRARRNRRPATRQEDDSSSESKPSERGQHRNTNREAASEAEQAHWAGEEGGGGPPRAGKALSVAPVSAGAGGMLWFSAPSASGCPGLPPVRLRYRAPALPGGAPSSLPAEAGTVPATRNNGLRALRSPPH